DYSYHSHYRFARRLQWHRGRTVLWHRILWRRWPRAHHRHLADPAPARTDLSFRSRHHSRKRVIQYAAAPTLKSQRSSEIRHTPLSRSMTAMLMPPPVTNRTVALSMSSLFPFRQLLQRSLYRCRGIFVALPRLGFGE